MDFTPSPDHESIREAIRKICANFDDDYWSAKDEAHEFPWDFYDALAEGGWVGIAIPEEFGGGGQGITEASVIPCPPPPYSSGSASPTHPPSAMRA